MKQKSLGKSVEGRSIEVLSFFDSPLCEKKLLLIGGVHGDEPEGTFLVSEFVKSGLWKKLEGQATLYVIPELNPDGCLKQQRMNANKVDLNRNMPTKDWDPVAHKERYNPGPKAGSEPETQIIAKFIEEIKPHLIITCHSYDPMININGPCRKVAEHMQKFNNYEITPYIGYPTPGSMGTWAGQERNIPTITLEIARDSQPKEIWETHSVALIESLIYAATHSNLDE